MKSFTWRFSAVPMSVSRPLLLSMLIGIGAMTAVQASKADDDGRDEWRVMRHR